MTMILYNFWKYLILYFFPPFPSNVPSQEQSMYLTIKWARPKLEHVKPAFHTFSEGAQTRYKWWQAHWQQLTRHGIVVIPRITKDKNMHHLISGMFVIFLVKFLFIYQFLNVKFYRKLKKTCTICYYIHLVLSLILLVKFSNVINKYKWYSTAVEYHSYSHAISLL